MKAVNNEWMMCFIYTLKQNVHKINNLMTFILARILLQSCHEVPPFLWPPSSPFGLYPSLNQDHQRHNLRAVAEPEGGLGYLKSKIEQKQSTIGLNQIWAIVSKHKVVVSFPVPPSGPLEEKCTSDKTKITQTVKLKLLVLKRPTKSFWT